MLKTYKILSILLSYPTKEIDLFMKEAVSELKKEAYLTKEKIKDIVTFINYYENMELLERQAEYVQLFDLTRSASLYLFEHAKGDSKERGQAMVDLAELYRENGMHLSSQELPDYLPVFLEFLSTLTFSESAKLLSEPIHIIQRIYQSLKEKNHPYSHVLSAVVSLSAKLPNTELTKSIIKNQKELDPDSEYEEDPIEFSSNNPCFNCKI